MRRTTRRTASAFTALAVAASLALTGCGRDSGSDAGPGASKAISDAKASGTINVWAMGTEGEKLQDFVKDFEAANPDAKVKVTAIPWEAAHDKFTTAIAARQDPGREPGRHDLDGRVRRGRRPRPDARGPGRRVRLLRRRLGHHRVSAARRTASPGTSRRACSTTAPTWPRRPAGTRPRPTWDEPQAFAKDLQDKAGVEVRHQPAARRRPARGRPCMPFAWSNGAELTKDGGTEYTFDSPEMTEALDYYQSFFDEGYSPTRPARPG